jgi:phosphoribosylanthranilate isomerase
MEIKICGITREDDALAAAAAGADYVGLVFHPASPRFVTMARARRLVEVLPAGARAVGVFVNMAPDAVRSAAVQCGLHAVQVHGDEPPDGFDRMPCQVWRAFRLGKGLCVPDPARWPASRYVADSLVRGEYGGTGVAADWIEAARLAGRFPVMLGGGLTPANVADAIRAVRPIGVDVSSGVEVRPGLKDHAKILAFVAAARMAGEGSGEDGGAGIAKGRH